MTEFGKQLQAFKKKAYKRTDEVKNLVVAEVDRSVRHGSELTGAPGQPVDTGFLKNSWQTVWDTAFSANIFTRTKYARAIEDGTREGVNLTLRSQVGGFHSVKLTVAGYKRIVENAVATVKGKFA
jgi:hypothetical protein